MPRSLTANASAQKSLAAGARPRIVIRIDWAGTIGTKFYSDHDLAVPVTAEGRILNSADIELSLSERGVQAVSDVSVTLSDHDGVLAGYCGQTPLALKRATVYQHFVGNGLDDMVPLLVGYVDDPVSWKEDGAELSFDITDLMTGHNVTVGHVASVSEFPTIAAQDDGAALPLVFGRVDELKCVQVSGGLRGQLLRDLFASTTVAFVEGGEDFPQEQNITVTICAEEIEGVMRGRSFTITNRTPRYTAVFAGAAVRLKGDSQVYVASDARSLAIHKVYGLRNFKLKSGATGTRDVEQLVEVPAHLYEVSLNDVASFPSLGRPLTTLTFPAALTDLQGDDWASDEIWVEISGYTRDGSALVENPADVIRYLLQDFGDVPLSRIDATTFNAAAASLANHRFAFALSGERDLKDLAADLAMQAQCQLLVIAAKVYLFFVSDNPGAAQMDLSDAVVAEDSAERTWLPVEEIRSELSVSYAPDLSARSERKEKRFSLKDSEAEAAWGRRVEPLSLWAYRDPSMARSIAQHYLNHRARLWERARLKTFLDGLSLLPLDWVTVGNLPWWNAGQAARIESARLSSGDAEGGQPDAVEFDLFLPLAPGCAGTCEVACQAGGCEGAAEHASVACQSACETSCQEACQLVCVTTCQAACQTACQLACETAEEQPEPEYEFQIMAPGNVERGVAFEITIQSRVIDPPGDDTAYVPEGNVAISLLNAEEDSVAPETASASGWTDGAKTISCTVTGGSGPIAAVLHVEDTASGRVGTAEIMIAGEGDVGFSVTAPSSVVRDEAFEITIQSVALESGEADTGYTPSGVVTIAKAWETVGSAGSPGSLSPPSTDAAGWTDGAKTATCILSGGKGGGSMRISVSDPASGRTGAAEVSIEEAAYGFLVTCPSGVARDAAFNLGIQSVELPSGDGDTGYTPSGDVEIAVVSGDDGIAPSSTDNTGWTDGAKTVSCTLSGGDGPAQVLIRVRDTASGRVGYANFAAGESGDPNVTVAGAAETGFRLTVSGGEVTRHQAFALNLQAILIASGSSDTGYTPSGDVNLSDTEGTFIPDGTDNTGWTDGGKNVTAMILGASTGKGTVVGADDPNSSREGEVLFLAEGETVPSGWDHGENRIAVLEPAYAFSVTAPPSVKRAESFEIAIQSIVAETGAADTAYAPAGSVTIFTDSESDTAAPAATADVATAWTASTSYAEGDLRLPVTPNGYVYECTAAGVSGSTPPSWPTALGESVDDGTAAWVCRATEWTNGIQILSVVIDGGSGEAAVRLYAQDAATGRTGYAELTVDTGYEFDLTAPESVDPDTDFEISIQSIESVSGDPDTAYTPEVEVELTDDHIDYELTPRFVNDIGWTDGAKTVICRIQGSTTPAAVRVTAEDHDSGRTGYIDIIVGQLYGFLVTAPANVARGVSFNITIQAVWNDTGEPDTGYSPDGNVTVLPEDKTDPADSLDPSSTDNTGWTDGKKTVGCTVTGGSSAASLRIVVTDPQTGREGSVVIAVAAASTLRGASSPQGFYGTDFYLNYGIDDNSASAAPYWLQVQVDAKADCDNDTAIGSMPVISKEVMDEYGYAYIRFSATRKCGCFAVNLSAGDKSGLIAANLVLYTKHIMNLYNGSGTQWAAQAHTQTLNIRIGESLSEFASGAQLHAATPHQSVSYQQINQMCQDAGQVPANYLSSPIHIPIPKSAIENLTGEVAYLWFWFSGSAIPYVKEDAFDQVLLTLGGSGAGLELLK